MFDFVLYDDDVRNICGTHHLRHCHRVLAGHNRAGIYPGGAKNVYHVIFGKKLDWRGSVRWMDILP